ncbi:hypothetical protein HDU87_004086 [Geranomyces variabilis]|uniref:Uncharacterized protein n=1 Tax=Geranomyces variabilis TaxID=109894 RepID=A0AAD5TT84_9FUNG|nr:hypothetical protein HDU87_004086 [Geranomyces variabilis]
MVVPAIDAYEDESAYGDGDGEGEGERSPLPPPPPLRCGGSDGSGVDGGGESSDAVGGNGNELCGDAVEAEFDEDDAQGDSKLLLLWKAAADIGGRAIAVVADEDEISGEDVRGVIMADDDVSDASDAARVRPPPFAYPFPPFPPPPPRRPSDAVAVDNAGRRGTFALRLFSFLACTRRLRIKNATSSVTATTQPAIMPTSTTSGRPVAALAVAAPPPADGDGVVPPPPPIVACCAEAITRAQHSSVGLALQNSRASAAEKNPHVLISCARLPGSQSEVVGNVTHSAVYRSTIACRFPFAESAPVAVLCVQTFALANTALSESRAVKHVS